MYMYKYICVCVSYSSWWKLHKNATLSFELILEAASHKIAGVRPLSTHYILLNMEARETIYTWYCWGSKDELIIHVLH